jgi:hypothetical protein
VPPVRRLLTTNTLTRGIVPEGVKLAYYDNE